MKNIAVIFMLVTMYSSAQTQSMPLPAVKLGRWFLIDGKREIQLPEQYSSVGLFDSKGTASFSQFNKYGILGRNGNELIPADYFSIMPLGNGYYECNSANGTELLYATEASQRKILCDSIVVVEPAWLYFEKDTNRFLLNTFAHQEIALQNQEIVSARFNYLLLYADSAHLSLLNPEGKLIAEDSVYLWNHELYFEYKTAKMHLVVDQNGTLEIPAKAENIWTTDEKIHYSLNRTAFLIDRESRKTIVSVQGEEIEVFDNTYYKIIRNGLQGLMDKTGKIVLQPEYSSIWKSEDYYDVTQNGKAGLVDLQFRKIVPCEYRYVSCDQHFVYTYSIIGGQGLISRITGKEILRPMYNRIQVEKTLIKAWAGSNLSIVEITSNHQVKSKFMLDNAISLNPRTYKADREKIDNRLFSIGWFNDSIVTFDSTKLIQRVRYKWGIQTPSDSILLRPRYNQPLFVPGAPVSLMKAGSEPGNSTGNWDSKPGPGHPIFAVFTMVNFSTGKNIPNLKVIDLDSSDFSKYGFSRFTHTRGNAILRSDATVVKVAHIDHSEEENLRVCYRGKEVLTEKKDAETVQIMSRLFNVPASPVSVKSGKKNYPFVKYENARWNFLDIDGNPVFKDSFAFAQKFYKQTAIVKSSEGWGLVRKDSVVIPLIYGSVERVPEYKDTVFKVMAISRGKIYFDSLFRPLTSYPGKLEKQNGNLSLFSLKGKTRILGKNYELIREENKPFYLYDFDRFSIKTKKVYEIYDGEGKSLGESAAKPGEFLDEDFFTSGLTGKMGLMSTNGDTIAPFIFNSIVKCGNVFLAENTSQSNLYDQGGTLIKSLPFTTILVDSVSGNHVEIAEGKINFFDRAGNKTGKFKSALKFQHYFNGFLFSEQDNYTILASDATEILAGQHFSEVQFLENGFCALYNPDKKWLIFDSQWKPVAAEITDIKKIKPLGENVLSLQVKNQYFLLDMGNREIHNEFSKINGTWKDGLLLVSTDFRKSRWTYINRDFEQPFKRSFSRAKPFSNGFACVADASGWTIIGRDGLPKSLPSYGELEQTGHQIFRMNALPTYGLIDSYGKVIIEPIYEKITLLQDNLIQVIKDGQIGYFDYQGKVIYPIQ